MKLTIFILTLLSFVGRAHTSPTAIDRDGIRQTIRSNIQHFQNCYVAALKRNADANGKIVVEWEIHEAGAAKNAKVVESTTNDPLFEQCIVDTTLKMTYPSPPEGQIAQVKYPFVFATGASKIPRILEDKPAVTPVSPGKSR